MKPKVLISDALSVRAVDIFRERGIDVELKTGLKSDELKSIIGQYHGLAIRSATKVTPDILTAAKQLKVIGRAGIGVDNVDVIAATGRGIVVMNTPYGNSITTAEHAIAMMFALARQIPAANASTHAGKWEKSKFMGMELTSKTLGVIGCGNIGSIVADRALGLKMRVVAYDPFLTPERAQKLGVEKVELDGLLAVADIITLHTPMTDQTRGILNAKAIAKCKKGVYIVNCARGGLVVEADLIAALDSGHVAGAALDVFEVEPAKEHALFGRENVVCTPHLGASTTEAQENVALQIAEQMSDYLLNGAVANALNMPSVALEDAPRLRPYLRLAELLGTFAGQCLKDAPTAITLEYEGETAAVGVKPITATALMAVLRPSLDSVNLVNAPIIAADRGINVSETKRPTSGNYRNLMRLKVETKEKTLTLTGTLFDGNPRLVGIDNVTLEAEITPQMLFVRNKDKPGFIGKLGTTLGNAGINIANFNLGRAALHADAVCLVSIDSAVPTAVIDGLLALPDVVEARSLTFPEA